jgi:hypothetical protein
MTLEKDSQDIHLAINYWKNFPPSYISEHNSFCCKTAKEWLLSMDRSFWISRGCLVGPSWIRERYEWGPSSWPLYWCEIPNLKEIDCGGLAAIARELFSSRGLVSLSAQLILQFSDQIIHHWKRKWMFRGYPTTWIFKRFIYHEACAVLVGSNIIKIWDPVNCFWMSPAQSRGHGSVQAIKISGVNIPKVIWEDNIIPIHKWLILNTLQ